MLRHGTLISFALLFGCSAEAANDPVGLFGPGVAAVTLEVDYEAGAEPFESYALRPGSPWELVQTNLEALFAASAPRELVVPQSLAEMEALGELGEGPDYDYGEIIDIAARNRDLVNTVSARTYYIVFLDGYYEDEGARQEQVLGVSLGDTGVIAIFKPVIGTGADALRRFVEQTTLIHELGHAMGLVNNGLPLASAHHDAEHGAHCDNERCVMYWLNEGASDALEFARQRITGGGEVIFGGECLADAQAAAESD